MAIHESGENYLEAILLLSQEQRDVHSVDVARRLGVSQPTVTKAMKILMQEGYVVMEGVHLHLTQKGEEHAQSVYEKHTVITQFWTALGVSPQTAEKDACRMEHIISDEVFAVMKQSVLKMTDDAPKK